MAAMWCHRYDANEQDERDEDFEEQVAFCQRAEADGRNVWSRRERHAVRSERPSMQDFASDMEKVFLPPSSSA